MTRDQILQIELRTATDLHPAFDPDVVEAASSSAPATIEVVPEPIARMEEQLERIEQGLEDLKIEQRRLNLLLVRLLSIIGS